MYVKRAQYECVVGRCDYADVIGAGVNSDTDIEERPATLNDLSM